MCVSLVEVLYVCELSGGTFGGTVGAVGGAEGIVHIQVGVGWESKRKR